MDTRISSRTSVVVAIIVAVMALLGAPAGAAPGDGITDYALPDGAAPWEIAAGPDGNLWYTDVSGRELDSAVASGVENGASDRKIGRITPDGTVTEYPLPRVYSVPQGIAAGPDGNMWFTEYGWYLAGVGNAIGRITPDGTITEYPLPTNTYGYGPNPNGITAGPDGNLWFTRVSTIGRITPTGAITEYPLPTPDSGPGGITAGPDGNLWFTEPNANNIGRITPAGEITEYPIPTAGGRPERIAAGPDGNMWFTEWGRIGRITPVGSITEYPLPTANSRPAGIAAGPDGNMWFTEYTGHKIGRITPTGTITEYPLPPYGSYPHGITAGPDGNMWFTESGRIGRINPNAAPTMITRTCPINAKLHKPTPKKVGNRILTHKIATDTFTCSLPFKPVVRCRPLASTTAGKKASCATKVTTRGKVRVNTKGYKAVRVTVSIRATPWPAFADRWKPDTWRKSWLLR